jgi:hypothetical protein
MAGFQLLLLVGVQLNKACVRGLSHCKGLLSADAFLLRSGTYGYSEKDYEDKNELFHG